MSKYYKTAGIGLSALLLCAITYSVLPGRAATTFNVKTYGAVGDGTTDDTKAIKEAIAEAEKVPGSTVLFPDGGSYLFSGNLHVSGVKLTGAGNSSLFPADANSVVDLSGVGSEIHTLSFYPAAQQPPSGGVAIRVTGASKFVLDKLFFSSGFQRDIVVANSSSGTIAKTTCNVTTGLDKAVGFRLEQSSSDVTLSDNQFFGTYLGDGVNDFGVEVDNCTRITVYNNGFETLSEAVRVFNSLQVSVSRTLASEVFIGINGRHNNLEKISNNGITGGSQNVTGILDAFGEDPVIENNIVQSVQNGIALTNATKASVSGNQVTTATGTALSVVNTNIATIISNTLTTAAQGIYLFECQSPAVTANKISKIQSIALQSLKSFDAVNISNNQITDAGLALQAPTPAAVIYVKSPNAESIVIQQNKYAGNTKNLDYYIWCQQGPPKAIVSGNSTNTMLPNRIGS